MQTNTQWKKNKLILTLKHKHTKTNALIEKINRDTQTQSHKTSCIHFFKKPTDIYKQAATPINRKNTNTHSQEDTQIYKYTKKKDRNKYL